MSSKPKIINMALTSSSNRIETVHFRKDSKENQFDDQEIRQGAYQALKILSQVKSKFQRQNQSTRKIKSRAELIGREQKEVELKLPSSVFDSICVVLKIYLNTRSGGKQFNRHKTGQNQVCIRNQLTQTNRKGNKSEIENQTAMFDWQKEKLIVLIKELSLKLQVCQQKIRQNNQAIDNFYIKEAQIKKKHKQEIESIIRSKNILQISSLFEKQLQELQGKPLIGIDGKTVHSRLKASQLKPSTNHSSAVNTLLTSSSPWLKNNSYVQQTRHLSRTNLLSQPLKKKTIATFSQATGTLKSQQTSGILKQILNKPLDQNKSQTESKKIDDLNFQMMQMQGFYDDQANPSQDIQLYTNAL